MQNNVEITNSNDEVRHILLNVLQVYKARGVGAIK